MLIFFIILLPRQLIITSSVRCRRGHRPRTCFLWRTKSEKLLFWWLVSRYWVPFPVSSLHTKFCDSYILILTCDARIQICDRDPNNGSSMVSHTLSQTLFSSLYSQQELVHSIQTPSHCTKLQLSCFYYVLLSNVPFPPPCVQGQG